MIKALPFLAVYLLSLNASAQISGNQVYNNNTGEYYTIPTTETIAMGDTAIMVSANILMSQLADEYIITLALNEEGKTLKEINATIDRRISNFITAAVKTGSIAKDIYTDFISQTKVYDYKVSESNAVQYLSGFEVKKNIIIKTDDHSKIDKLLLIAAENGIYDVVKVDYNIKDPKAVYERMINAAADIIDSKKRLYLKLTNANVHSRSKIATEQFFTSSPRQQYNSYTAKEEQEISESYYNNRNLLKIDKRKTSTSYYNSINPAIFDAVLNDITPIVGVQHVLVLKMIFDLKKS